MKTLLDDENIRFNTEKKMNKFLEFKFLMLNKTTTVRLRVWKDVYWDIDEKNLTHAIAEEIDFEQSKKS